MSCWLLDDTHLDALLTAAVVWGDVLTMPPQEMGQILRAVNAASYQARYGNVITGHPQYTFTMLGTQIDPLVVASAIRCFDYQACETDTWDDRPTASERQAQGFLRKLALAALRDYGVEYPLCPPADYRAAEQALGDHLPKRYDAGGGTMGWPVEDPAIFGPPLRVVVREKLC